MFGAVRFYQKHFSPFTSLYLSATCSNNTVQAIRYGVKKGGEAYKRVLAVTLFIGEDTIRSVKERTEERNMWDWIVNFLYSLSGTSIILGRLGYGRLSCPPSSSISWFNDQQTALYGSYERCSAKAQRNPGAYAVIVRQNEEMRKLYAKINQSFRWLSSSSYRPIFIALFTVAKMVRELVSTTFFLLSLWLRQTFCC